MTGAGTQVHDLLGTRTAPFYAQAVGRSTVRHRSAPKRRTYALSEVCRARRLTGRAGESVRHRPNGQTATRTGRRPNRLLVGYHQSAVPDRLNRVYEHVDPLHSIRYTGRPVNAPSGRVKEAT